MRTRSSDLQFSLVIFYYLEWFDLALFISIFYEPFNYITLILIGQLVYEKENSI